MPIKFFHSIALTSATIFSLVATQGSASAFVIYDSKEKEKSGVEAVPAPSFVPIPTSNGIFFHNSDNGHISYCSNTVDPGTHQPAGVCESIGLIEKSSSGFAYSAIENSIYIVNKSSGAITQCAVTLLNGTSVKGGCQQRASLHSL